MSGSKRSGSVRHEPSIPAAAALAALCVAALAAVAVAGPEPELLGAPGPGSDSGSVVEARLRPAAAAAAPGDTVRLAVQVEVADGWHLYAHGDTTYYGIELALPEDAPCAPARVDYPEGEEVELFGEKAHVLHGRLELPLAAVVAPQAPPGRAELELILTVQACNDRLCLAPAFLPLPLRLDVRPPKARP